MSLPKPSAGWRAAVAVALAVPLLAACGKKAPLRLPDERAAERAGVPRVLVRDGHATLEFAVPGRRVFPEREEPWVLARVLRRQGAGGEFVEAGTILEAGGFAFEAPLTWRDDAAAVPPLAYRVEFRDAQRRRRALSEPVEIPVAGAAGAPAGLRVSGDDRAVHVSWSAPEGADAAVRYRVYRRDAGGDAAAEPLGPAPAAALSLVDSRVSAGREYCYRVRAVAGPDAVQVEGPFGDEVCVRAEDATAPPPPRAVRVSAGQGSFMVSWDPVDVPDLLGYRVYRAVGAGVLEPLTPQPLPGTVFRDDAGGLEPGTRLRYAVTAVDGSARRNESPLSPFADIEAGR
jgi:hypothetical protein